MRVQLLAMVDQFGGDGLGVSELARRTDIPKSTVFRLLHTLENSGAVERRGEHYRTGPLSAPTGPARRPARRQGADATDPLLSVLYEQTRETSQLGVLRDGELLFLNKLHGVHRAHSPSRIGGRAPAHATSLGKVLMAFDRESADRVCASELVAFTDRTITDGEALRVELAKVARTRIGVDDNEYVEGVSSVAGVVTDAAGRPVASLALTGPTTVARAGYEQLLLDVCARASAAMRD
ncbi:IclR family transcriptional regulator [Janibacter limosus]|uniref:IclR family transcriptional regulator n=1 Tax=Janibacter limosus TaxID=53458 RepID=UPI0035DC5E27|nr:IclR family transcriptional regulator [Janibacter limosus]